MVPDEVSSLVITIAPLDGSKQGFIYGLDVSEVNADLGDGVEIRQHPTHFLQ